MRVRHHLAAAVLASFPVTSAGAHPHIFIDTGMQLIFDAQGKLAAVRVVWVYDEFISLVILEDKGLDPDGDGVLTTPEKKSLQGFDMNWDPGFAGDLYALQDERSLALSRPLQFTATLEKGRLISTHVRAFEPRVAVTDEPVRVQVYDPDYYTAYKISTEPVVEGRTGCSAEIFVPDPSKASKELEAALAELGAFQTLEDLEIDNFPAIGAAYSEEVRITCAP